jgi:hypothetical protein
VKSFLSAVLIVALCNGVAYSQWSSSAAEGTTVSAVTGTQRNPAACSDGAGGAICFWRDDRSGNNDIYAQRFNAQGVAQWTTDGIPVVSEATNEWSFSVASDGNGGAIVAWASVSSGIFAQRINSSGAPQWGASGVAVVVGIIVNQSTALHIVSDDNGGAFVGYDMGGDGITINRLNSAGTKLWGGIGIIINPTGAQTYPRLAANGLGAVYVTWTDGRNGVDTDIYTALVGSGGVTWTTAVSQATGNQQYPFIAVNSGGNALVGWLDPANAGDVYVQRLRSDGTKAWSTYPNGYPITSTSAADFGYSIVPYGPYNSFYVGYASAFSVYIATVGDNTGPLGEGTNPNHSSTNIGSAFVNTAIGVNLVPVHMISDGENGVIATWTYATNAGSQGAVFAERLRYPGSIRTWGAGPATPVNVATSPDTKISCIPVSTGGAGAIIVYDDRRNGTDFGVFASHVNGTGSIGPYPGELLQVNAGETASFYSAAAGTTITITANTDVDGGWLHFQSFNTNPGGTFSGTSTSPDSTSVTPNAINPNRYWQIDSLGVGPATYTISVDITGVAGIVDPDKVVLCKRANSSFSWFPLNTTRVGNVHSSAGLTSFSDFGIGSQGSAVTDWSIY